MNTYGYVYNNPILFIDELGLVGYWDSYRNFVDRYSVNLNVAANLLLFGVMPKSLAPAGDFRGPLLGSKNDITSVIRGMTGYNSGFVQGTAATIGLASVGIGIYDAAIEVEGFVYALGSQDYQAPDIKNLDPTLSTDILSDDTQPSTDTAACK